MAFAIVLLLAGSSLAQTGGTLDLSWNTIDGGGGTITGGTVVMHGTAGQPDASDLTGGTLTLKGGFWQVPAAPPPGCVNDADCNDTDVCTFDECLSGVCSHSANLYGDVDHDGDVDLFDLFCILNGFSNDFSNCSFKDVDLDPCGGDGDIDLFDLFAVLNAFSDVDPCCSGLMPASPPVLGLSRGGRIEASEAVITLVPAEGTVHPGDVISVDVFLSGVADLRGYQVAVEVTGLRLAPERSLKGSRIRLEAKPVGGLEPESVVIESARVDYVFGQLQSFQATDETNWRMIGALIEGGVVSEQDAYLGTITLRASPDARGPFRITVRAEDTALLDSAGQEIRVRSTDSSTISVR